MKEVEDLKQSIAESKPWTKEYSDLEDMFEMETVKIESPAKKEMVKENDVFWEKEFGYMIRRIAKGLSEKKDCK